MGLAGAGRDAYAGRPRSGLASTRPLPILLPSASISLPRQDNLRLWSWWPTQPCSTLRGRREETTREWGGNATSAESSPSHTHETHLLCVASRRALCGFRKKQPHPPGRVIRQSFLSLRPVSLAFVLTVPGRPLGSGTVRAHGDVELGSRGKRRGSGVIGQGHGGVLPRIDCACRTAQRRGARAPPPLGPPSTMMWTCATPPSLCSRGEERGRPTPRVQAWLSPSLFLSLWRVGPSASPSFVSVSQCNGDCDDCDFRLGRSV